MTRTEIESLGYIVTLTPGAGGVLATAFSTRNSTMDLRAAAPTEAEALASLTEQARRANDRAGHDSGTSTGAGDRC